MQSTKYPHLQALLSGWFHQDFDVVGDSIEAIVTEFKMVSTESDAQSVASDIKEFISIFAGRVDKAFGQEFDLDIDPTAFAPSVEAFLMEILACLKTR